MLFLINMQESEIIIIGGGLAGLTAGVHLSKNGFDVTVIEKNTYPKHKVCGEYISNEVLNYFNFLGIDIKSLNPTKIDTLEFSDCNGKVIKSKLPLGGFGVSRYILDHYLYQKAVDNNCKFIFDSVESVNYQNEVFTVETTKNLILKSQIVLGAFGKRSNIDLFLNRKFIEKKSDWLGIKSHYKGVFKNNFVALHNFEGGYCGVSKVENKIINICYLVNYNAFKKYKNTVDFESSVLCKNPNLKEIFENTTMVFDKPLAISQISFSEKNPIENHLLMIGDTAGLIHPLCGNGMAMAIHSAKIASELVSDFKNNKILNRRILEFEYTKRWNKNFRKRLQMGRYLGKLLQQPRLTNIFLKIFVKMPFLLPIIIKRTHGKPF